MTPDNDNRFNETTTIDLPKNEPESSQPPKTETAAPYVPLRLRPNFLKDNAMVLIVGAFVVILLVVIALESASRHTSTAQSKNKPGPKQARMTTNISSTPEQSILPTTQASKPPEPDTNSGLVSPDQIARTAKPRAAAPATTAVNLARIPPFEGTNWQPAPYPPPPDTPNRPSTDYAAPAKNENEKLDKASLVFIRSTTEPTADGRPDTADLDFGVGLPPGTKLRARLESAVNTAVRTPVVAVVEYNYEQDRQIVIPAGAKAFGHLEAADRSGYVGVHFDSLMMPDGSSVRLDAAATDLSLRPLKGKVEGKNTGKNILVRSLQGVGETLATVLGQGSLNQTITEEDLLRARIASNIGESSDQEVARLAFSERIVVSVPANTEIYVLLERSADAGTGSTKQPLSTTPSPRPIQRTTNLDELRQLLQLQRELNQSGTATTSMQ